MSLPIRALGTSSLEVSRCTLGTSALSSWGGHDVASGAEVVRAALELGITAVDTAPAYADGEAEEVVGCALADRRDDVVVMTKFPEPHLDERPPPVDEIPRMLEASLRRLGTDHVDLYQLHDHRPGWPIDDVLEVLHTLVDAGTVRAIGTTRLRPEELVEAEWAAQRSGRHPFRTAQAPYSLLVREAERGVFGTCVAHGIGVLAHAPHNGSWLSGRYRADTHAPADSRARTWPVRRDRYDQDRPAVRAKLEVVEALIELANEVDLNLPTFALAWALAHPGVDSVVVGPRTVDHLAVVPAALDVTLPADLLARVDELVPPGTSIDPLDLPTYLAGARQSRAPKTTTRGPS